MLPHIVNDLDYLVDKYDYFVLQRFCGLCELLDAHDTENHVNLGTADHDVHEFVSVCQCFSHDFGTQFTETALKQIADFVDGLLQYHSFHLTAIISLRNDCVVRFELIRLFKGVLRQFLNNHDNLLDRLDHNAFGVV